MKIAVAGLITKKITADVSGGTEIFTKMLVDGLVDRGHDVTLYCARGSQTKAQHQVEICDSEDAMGKESNLEFVYPYTLLEIRQILEDVSKSGFDILHVNFLKTFMLSFFADQISIPVLYTVHRDFFESPKIYKAYERIGFHNNEHFVFVSQNAKEKSILKNQCDFVYNGIKIADYPFYEGHENKDFLWLSRVDPRKGLKEAVAAAKKAGVKLNAVGNIDRAEYSTYFDTEVAPLFDDDIKFIVHDDHNQKIDFYQKAKAFLFPIQWEEPFGLVFLEAMACGTPVIAFARGSVPEIIVDGVTGFIVNSSDDDIRGDWIIKKTGIEGLTEAIQRINSMSKEESLQMRKNCRMRVEENFTIEKMVEGYEQIYRKIIGASS
jgi:glycosyltransferase involved in cell wall biosynthesis